MTQFIKTNEKIEFTFSGWDGKSYNGEVRTQNAFTHPAHPEKKFIKFYSRRYKEYTYHVILDELHPATQVHKVRYWCSEN